MLEINHSTFPWRFISGRYFSPAIENQSLRPLNNVIMVSKMCKYNYHARFDLLNGCVKSFGRTIFLLFNLIKRIFCVEGIPMSLFISERRKMSGHWDANVLRQQRETT